MTCHDMNLSWPIFRMPRGDGCMFLQVIRPECTEWRARGGLGHGRQI
jgi:hypothetical protein